MTEHHRRLLAGEEQRLGLRPGTLVGRWTGEDEECPSLPPPCRVRRTPPPRYRPLAERPAPWRWWQIALAWVLLWGVLVWITDWRVATVGVLLGAAVCVGMGRGERR